MLLTVSFTTDHTLKFLPAYWHSLLLPCLSLLADECQLSIIAIEQATPLLLNGIYYQLVNIAQSPQAKQILINNYFSTYTHAVQGINFQQIAQLRSKITPFHQAFFSNDKAFWLMIGLVAARTGISPKSLQPLVDWLAFLALKSTAQYINLTHIHVNDFMQWLPYSLPDPKFLDSTLLESTLVDSDIRPSSFFKPSYNLLNIKTKTIPIKDFFAEHQSILKSYQQSQPFAILPLAINNNQQNAAPTLSQPSKPTLPKNPASPSKDIFIAKTSTKTPLLLLLQKHWMAFAVGLTALIIGGIGAVATTNKTSTTAPTIDNKTLAEIPHDVAIVRTDTNATKTSATNDFRTKSPKPSSDRKHPTDKDTKKTPAQKLKSDKSAEVKANKSPTSNKKAVTNQLEKVSTNKKTKSTTTKKTVNKSVQSHKDDDD